MMKNYHTIHLKTPIHINQQTYHKVEVTPEHILLKGKESNHLSIDPDHWAMVIGFNTQDNDDLTTLVKHAMEHTMLHWQVDKKKETITGINWHGSAQAFTPEILARQSSFTDEAELITHLTHMKASIQSPPPVATFKGTNSLVADISGSLAKGLAGHIGGAIGGLIIDAIFPQKSLESYFDELYRKISELIHQEVTQTVISTINGNINGVVAFMRNTYAPRKKAGASKQELLSMLTPYSQDIYTHVTYPLMEEQFQDAGFSVFLIAASVHLALIQEQAFVDPNAKTPEASSFAQTVKKQANDYAEFCESTWQRLSEARRDKIVLEYQKIYYPSERVVGATITDTFTGEQLHKATSMEEILFFIKGTHKKYQQQAVDNLSNELANDGGVDRIKQIWRELSNNPLPPQ